MEKYILGEIFSSGGATLYKNPSDQTVTVLPERLKSMIIKKNFNGVPTEDKAC